MNLKQELVPMKNHMDVHILLVHGHIDHTYHIYGAQRYDALHIGIREFDKTFFSLIKKQKKMLQRG